MTRGRIRSSLGACSAIALVAATVAAPTAAAAPSQAPTRAVCPGSFQVLHDDRVAGLRLAAGAYRVTVADPSRLGCPRATSDLSEFLQDFDGKLRRPWTVDAPTSTFQRGVDPLAAFDLARIGPPGNVPGGHNGPGPNPTAGSCPGFFTIRHDDHIGVLPLARARYRLTPVNPKLLSCSTAARRLAGFLKDFDGRLPRPWLLAAATGTFTRGAGSGVGFRVKPAVGTAPQPRRGGGYPAKGQPGECPGSFRVRHRDEIGRLVLPAGAYLTFVVRGSGVSCAELARALRGFLARSATPPGYRVNLASGTFSRAGRALFRIKPASPRVLTSPASR
jgi:hypothetical protein